MKSLSQFFYKQINIKVPLWFFIIAPLVFYLFWEIFWFLKVGLPFIKWHTHLMLYVYIWLTVVFFINLLSKKTIEIKNLFLSFSSLIVVCFFVECYLILSGYNKTYLEKVKGYYYSYYSVLDNAYYHCWEPPNKPHWIIKPEYSYWRPTNSLGFPDEEWVYYKKPKEKRILLLGDSFTEGDGAPYDSNYAYLLKHKLYSVDRNWYIMNAGVCGSDPFDNYINLKDRLLIYNPDIVVQSLGSQDLTVEIITRGGFERFQKNGTLKFNKAPWWEPIYALSYLSRIFFKVGGYNELLQKDQLENVTMKIINNQVLELFKRYSFMCKQNGIQLIVFLRPDRNELEQKKYQYDFSTILNQLKTDTTIHVIDLMPDYLNIIKSKNTPISEYFWQNDGHHNSKGYEIMAQNVFENIMPLIKDTVVSDIIN